MGNEDEKYLCEVCGQLHTKEILHECRSNYNAIQKHNNDRKGKGLKFKDDLFQFFSHVANKKCRDNHWLAYHTRQYDKIFINLKAFEKANGDIDFVGLINSFTHEYQHHWLFKNEGRRATAQWDFPNIRLTWDKEGYNGYVEIMPDSYYTALFDKSIIMKKALDELEKENKI